LIGSSYPFRITNFIPVLFRQSKWQDDTPIPWPSSCSLFYSCKCHRRIIACRNGNIYWAKSLSFEIGESKAFYQIIEHAIQFVIEAPPSPMTPAQHSTELFHRFKRDALRSRLITASDHAHRARMHQFAECIYTGVANDDDFIKGRKNLDFVLENPNSEVSSYPAMTI
jgi:hypothetical protein